jgi:hypothetical protein
MMQEYGYSESIVGGMANSNRRYEESDAPTRTVSQGFGKNTINNNIV